MKLSTRLTRYLGSATLALTLLANVAGAVAAAPPAPVVAAAPVVHVVRYGDTLAAIAHHYDVTVRDLTQANNLRTTWIFPGQRLVIPVAAPAPNQDYIPVEVGHVMVMQLMNMRSGPGKNYPVIRQMEAGRVLPVIGISADRQWWKVECPDGARGSCWLKAEASLTLPTDGPGRGTTHIPVLSTDVREVVALTDVNIRRGPGKTFAIEGRLYQGEYAEVVGISADGQWWAVRCPSFSGSGYSGKYCWLKADAGLTQPAPTSGGETNHIPVYPTNVRGVLALTDVNMRLGPATSFPIEGRLYRDEYAQVLGVSADGEWWAVRCPGGNDGTCWLSAKPHLTQPYRPS